MVKLTDLVKYPVYAVLPFVLGCGSADYSPNFDKGCLDRARDEAVLLSVRDVDNMEGFCRDFGHNVVFTLQKCLAEAADRTYKCIRVREGMVVGDEAFIDFCLANIGNREPLDHSIDYWCAEFHQVPDK